MSVKIHLRDWYYNAGVVGFLNVLSEGEKNLDKILTIFNNKIYVNDNSLEFSTDILENFYEKYKKLLFDIFFNIDNYQQRVANLLNKLKQPKQVASKKVLQESGLSGKVINEFIKNINNGEDLNNIFNKDTDIIDKVSNIKSLIDNFQSNIDVYNNLAQSSFIDYFFELEVKRRICNYQNIEEYINKISNSLSIPNKNEQACFICLKYRKEYDFSNAITQVLGFNSDNANWIWGFQTSKAKICALCAFIYSCAVHGMVFLKRNIEREYKTFFYVLNRNSNISTLYSSFWIFKEKIAIKNNQNKPFYTVLQEVLVKLIGQKAQAFSENINFIEIAENQFGGQSTKSYNVYNYNITKRLSEFIQTIGDDNIPKGFYKIQDFYVDITEEILKKTVESTLTFSDLANYFEYYMRDISQKSNIIVRYSIYKVTNFILEYINTIKGGNQMQCKQIVNKAFHNGKMLGEKIGYENKIKGIAYQLLNDLKISDKNSFMDKYLRLCMSYGVEIKLGTHEELSDIDNFMSFGYAFLNGLLSHIKTKENEEDQNG